MSRPSTVEALALDAGLSPRECEVLFAYAAGLTVAEIAAALGIEPITVDVHLSNIGRRIRAEWERRTEEQSRKEEAADALNELRARKHEAVAR